MAHPPYELRKTWRNHLGNQAIDPLRIYRPRSIDDVVAIVRAAEEAGVTARAVGSGHSWSDVALADGYLMRTDGLARVPAAEQDDLAPAWAGRRLVRAEAGIRLRELNAWLDRNGLALRQMGGYDHQTVAGVISTSTHGSGTSFGPLNDFAHSLDMVVAEGRVVRVERAGGPTDRAAWEARHGDGRTLLQDDDVFDAAVVGMGCMGVICTALLEVEPKYWLREIRELHPWSKVRADLEDGAVLDDNEHYELVFSPYERKHAYPCLVTTRNRIADPRRSRRRMRNPLVELAASLPVTSRLLNLVLHVQPSLAPMLLESAMQALVNDRYDEVGYKVFNIGNANLVPAYSAEVGIPMDGRHIEAVERVIEVAAERRRLGDVYQSSPIALRFVKASPAYLSMMHGRDTMMMELIQLRGNEGGYELLGAYEEALYALGGRPHWGQVNTLTGSHGLVASMYPRYEDWQRVHRRLNATGVFDSPFSKRVGIAADRFTP